MFERRLPKAFRTREATLSPWLTAGHQDAVVRRLLGVLSDAFDWRDGDSLRLRPEDQVWAIYREYYPSRGWIGNGPDGLEMETLVVRLSHDIPDIQERLQQNQALTVGELARLLAAAGGPTTRCS